jgi:hypothetical protein
MDAPASVQQRRSMKELPNEVDDIKRDREADTEV